jgi:hypothetical protein
MSDDRMSEAQYAQYIARLKQTRVQRAPAILPDIESPKRAKYRNTRVDGFDSMKERDVWTMLELRARAGEITELQRQVSFALIVNGIHVCDYRSDYSWREGARLVVADCKSPVTRKLQMYRIKFKLMQACHGITLVEL